MHVNAGVLDNLLSSDLKSAGWDGSTVLDQGKSPRQAAMGLMASSLTKKFVGEVTSAPVAAATLALWRECNELCGRYVPIPQQTECQTWDVELYGEVKDTLYRMLNAPEELPDLRESSHTVESAYSGVNPDPDRGTLYGGQVFPVLSFHKVLLGLEVGPGASVGATESDFFSKMSDSPLSYTSEDLLRKYQQGLLYYPQWAASEIERQQHHGVARVVGSKLSFVPKTTSIARTICTEPLLNMLFQKGISRILRKRLRSFGIDLSTQPTWNAHLAQLGSITGGFCTIDLKSASDTISYSLVKDLIDPDNFYWLDLARSPSTTLPGGEIVQLNMLASMGNDFTFPLQTMLFTAIVHAVYKQHGLVPVPSSSTVPGNFGVFGDDIIVDTRVAQATMRALVLFGFQVNVNKSFFAGDFRESCGHDYYCGHNVRGVYLKSITHERDFFSAINVLMRWSCKWQVCLPSLLAYLRRGCRWLPVPYDEGDESGIKVPVELAPTYKRGPLAKGYTKAVQSGGFIYRYLKTVPRSWNLQPLGDDGVKPNGLMLTVLAGRISGGRITQRSQRPKAVIRVRYTPRWEYSASHHFTVVEGLLWLSQSLALL
jgi:hypothetical protein